MVGEGSFFHFFGQLRRRCFGKKQRRCVGKVAQTCIIYDIYDYMSFSLNFTITHIIDNLCISTHTCSS